MNVPEYIAKSLIASDLPVPGGRVVERPDDAGPAFAAIGGGPVALKAQIPAGKRGKSGGIRFASSAGEAVAEARALLGSEIAGHTVGKLLVEPKLEIAQELYAAVLNDARAKRPLILFSTAGGMDIEEVNATAPERIVREHVEIRTGLSPATARAIVERAGLAPERREAVAGALVALYVLYRRLDAQLLEINPLILDAGGALWALDCKLVVDDSARPRQQELFDRVQAEAPPKETDLERRAREQGLYFIELDGDVGVLANGAGLTMTTIDAITYAGGRPANFLEIGGDAYTKATPALQLVLSNPRVRSLLVNFCGAFARTDVMVDGVINAIETLRPTLPIVFSVHGTGEEVAIPMLRERLGVEPHDRMDDAVRAAVAAAKREPAEVVR